MQLVHFAQLWGPSEQALQTKALWKWIFPIAHMIKPDHLGVSGIHVKIPEINQRNMLVFFHLPTSRKAPLPLPEPSSSGAGKAEAPCPTLHLPFLLTACQTAGPHPWSPLSLPQMLTQILYSVSNHRLYTRYQSPSTSQTPHLMQKTGGEQRCLLDLQFATISYQAGHRSE